MPHAMQASGTTQPPLDELLRAARETVAKVRYCVAATPAADGGVNARVVGAFPPAEDWSVMFVTSASSRKTDEIRRTGRLTLVYQLDPEGAYVALAGQARVDGDTALKARVWTRGLDEWFPAGPDNPDAVVVSLATERIELWSLARGIMPEPRGCRAAVIEWSGENAWVVIQA